jgi:hypothetical protein
MANWLFTSNTTDEAPMAYNSLHIRYRIPRAISVKEITPGVYVEVRYDAYTNELGATNLPPVEGIANTGLHYFRGGYEHIVDDTVKADMISSGVATTLNFTAV